MAKSKKSKGNTTTKQADDQVEARPIGEGKDPLAEGARLHNESNTEAETHYKADDSELKAEENASKIRGQDANERAEEHNANAAAPVSSVPNSDKSEQDEVAAGREEEAAQNEVDDTPEEVEVPERTEEEQAEESAKRDEALKKDAKTFK